MLIYFYISLEGSKKEKTDESIKEKIDKIKGKKKHTHAHKIPNKFSIYNCSNAHTNKDLIENCIIYYLEKWKFKI